MATGTGARNPRARVIRSMDLDCYGKAAENGRAWARAQARDHGPMVTRCALAQRAGAAQRRECGAGRVPGPYLRSGFADAQGGPACAARPFYHRAVPRRTRSLTGDDGGSAGHRARRDSPHSLPVYDPHGPREECGVVGIYAPGQPVARLTAVGLHALQHRGQESAGIAAATARASRSTSDSGWWARSSTRRRWRGWSATGRPASGPGPAWRSGTPATAPPGQQLAPQRAAGLRREPSSAS